MLCEPPTRDDSETGLPAHTSSDDSVVQLCHDEVHVWSASLSLPQRRLQSLYRTLSQDEQQRAERFYFARDRDRFIAARGQLRTLLGYYLDLPPEQVSFRYGHHGKPALDASLAEPLDFNLAHAHDLALYALTRNRRIGIDLEYRRQSVPNLQIAEHFFAPTEVAALRRLPAALRPDAFLHCWTRKEAYIKARGEGLSYPLHSFEVSLAPGEPARLLRDLIAPEAAIEWTLCELRPHPEYIAALAVEGSGWTLRQVKHFVEGTPLSSGADMDGLQARTQF